MWVNKKAFPEPRRMKQVWVVKNTCAQPEVLITNEVRKMNQNKKSKEKKRRLQKFKDGGGSSTDQRYHEVSVSKPMFLWVPKISE